MSFKIVKARGSRAGWKILRFSLTPIGLEGEGGGGEGGQK